jgi:serine phosphatase RsbU (regulator of sigma subunit)
MPPGHLPVRSYLAVPVVTPEEEVAGGLFLGHEDAGVFDEEAERIAEGIASHAAIAIENARLYEERDRVARTLQESLLPPAVPAVEHLDLAARDRTGATQVSGDFHDVFPLGRYRWGVLVGDVGGSGVRAAAATAYARYTLRTAALLERHPSGALYVLDQSLREDEGPITTCSAIFAAVEADSGAATVVLARGGHPRPLIVRASSVSEAPGAGPLLGDQPGARFDDITVDLRAGDALVMHGEGVPEGRLQDALADCHGRSAADIADAVLAAADEPIAVLVIAVPAV